MPEPSNARDDWTRSGFPTIARRGSSSRRGPAGSADPANATSATSQSSPRGQHARREPPGRRNSARTDRASRLPVAEVRSALRDDVLPLRRDLVFGRDRVDRARFDAVVAIDALLGVHVEHLAASEPGSSAVGWMQSTGQISTHEVSLVPIHGSLITYVIGHPRELSHRAWENYHSAIFLASLCKLTLWIFRSVLAARLGTTDACPPVRPPWRVAPVCRHR